MNPSETETGTPETEATPHVPTGADYVSNRDFVDFPISEAILKGIHEMGYKTATPVQAVTLEPALAGRDLVVRAKTGTGKTCAFLVPAIERAEDGARVPKALILAPTRELAQQIAEEAEGLSAYRDVSVAVLVGGMPMGAQEKALAHGAEIIVGTPGRVLDHMRRGNLDPKAIQTAVLDEADEMLSMGFFEEVTSILDKLPKNRQILLFSATIAAETRRLIERYTEGAEEITLSTDMDQVSTIEHVLYETVPGFHKIRALLYLLDIVDPTSAILFCNTREDASMVAAYLDRQGLDVQLLSGELPQAQRNKVMAKVKRGEVRFLASTDVASRGIDISDLSHVINYSLPQDPALYLHRIGRTGRIGKKGTAISLVGATDLNTRRILENQHAIKFDVKVLPDAEHAVKMRVERQARQIRDALGQVAFEAYLPTVKALKEREDGDQLIAAALRAFFQWDRVRRADVSEGPSDAEIASAEADHGRRGKKHKDRDRDRDRDKKHKKDDRRERDERRPPAENLDALLSAEGESDDDKKKKRKRKRKKGKDRAEGERAEAGATETGATEATTPATGGGDDLDSLLSVD